jgi:microcystin-dependent protein
MSTPLLGEIKMFAGNFPPKGWATCDGQLLLITQNPALFSILGTTYGGNGTTNFALPDLRGRVPIHAGSGPGLSPYIQGQVGGEQNHTLLANEIPAHAHLVNGVGSGGNQASPVGNYPAVESTGTSLNFSNGAPTGTMNPGTIAPSGAGQPHNNLQPFSVVTFIIALAGAFPTRN